MIAMSVLVGFALNAQGADERVELRIYDISDLVETKPGHPGPDICLVTVKLEPLSAEAAKATETVIKMLKASNPDAWKASGVDIEERGGRLVVVHRTDVHKQIGDFLSQLRADVKKKLLEEKK